MGLAERRQGRRKEERKERQKGCGRQEAGREAGWADGGGEAGSKAGWLQAPSASLRVVGGILGMAPMAIPSSPFLFRGNAASLAGKE